MNTSDSGGRDVRGHFVAIDLTANGHHLWRDSDAPTTGTGRALRWRATLSSVHHRAAVRGDAVAVCGVDATLHVLDTRTGATHWSQAFSMPADTPVIFDDVIYLSGGERLHAFDIDNGIEAWSASVVKGGFTDPVIVDDVLYAGGQDSMLYAVEPRTGECYWHARMSAPPEAAPVVADALVVVRTMAGSIEAFEITTGEPCWQASAGWSLEPPGLVVTNGFVVTTGPGGGVIAFDLETGSPRWELETQGVSGGTPVSLGGLVVITSTLPSGATELISVDADSGIRCWSTTLDAGIASTMQVFRCSVLVGDRAGVVHALDGESGPPMECRDRGYPCRCDGTPRPRHAVCRRLLRNRAGHPRAYHHRVSNPELARILSRFLPAQRSKTDHAPTGEHHGSARPIVPAKITTCAPECTARPPAVGNLCPDPPVPTRPPAELLPVSLACL